MIRLMSQILKLAADTKVELIEVQFAVATQIHVMTGSSDFDLCPAVVVSPLRSAL